MTGFSDAREAAILDTQFSSAVYLRLFTGVAGLQVGDDGSIPGGLAELSTGGYAPLLVSAASWASAIGGSPSVKTVPNPTHSPINFTPSGVTWQVCSYAWTSDANAVTASNLISSGVFADVNSTPIVYTVLPGVPLSFTNAFPIVERLGDPPPGVNPT